MQQLTIEALLVGQNAPVHCVRCGCYLGTTQDVIPAEGRLCAPCRDEEQAKDLPESESVPCMNCGTRIPKGRVVHMCKACLEVRDVVRLTRG